MAFYHFFNALTKFNSETFFCTLDDVRGFIKDMICETCVVRNLPSNHKYGFRKQPVLQTENLSIVLNSCYNFIVIQII